MKTRSLLALALAAPLALPATNNQILGWNNLGMHCMDSDYSVFSILPPYNTIECQLIVAGKLVTNGAGYTVTYQAVADPDGSFNSTSRGKGNFYDFVLPLYGAALSPELGLTLSWPMPGTNNVPQGMFFEPTNHPAAGVATPVNWFRAEGIPLTPYDDTGRKNPYPMMRLIAHNSGGVPIATNDIVLPVSDEMDCRVCHASGTQVSAKPAAGWVWSTNPERDFRLNILRLHDEKQFANYAGLYQAALAARGFNPQGLYQGNAADGKPVLCATCHASEALGTGSYSNIPPLTASVHSKHAAVVDPDLHISLDSSAHRAACYRCHPGSATKCLRGAMGGAIATDGSMEMQCQSCHGNMSLVGTPFPQRVGWFMEPNCQSCHTGTATSNNGKIRFTTCFETNGAVRVATNLTFATQTSIPAPGLSLYRFSAGHGGLQCSACHGSTHAEFPATHRNDNVRNEKIQGHAGVMIECTSCHTAMPNTITGGPHGMHPVGNDWALNHGDLFEGTPPQATRQQCQACHGADYKGTVLSRAQGPRSLSTKFGTRTLWRGQQLGCYDCHDGANSSNPSTHPSAVAQNASTNTTSGAAVTLTLQATGAGTMTYRVASQPAHGSVGISNNVATYFSDPGYTGTDQFTFVANNGWVDSNLATGSVSVAEGPFSVSVVAQVPTNWPAGWPAPFSALATSSNTTAAVTFEWTFGDGSSQGTNKYTSHAYATPGTYPWTLVVHAATAAATKNGTIVIGQPTHVTTTFSPGALTLSWPPGSSAAVLEHSLTLDALRNWKPSTNALPLAPGVFRVPVSSATPADFYRARQVQ